MANEITVSKPPMMAGGRPMPIIPQSLEDCFRLASAIVKARMAPKGIDTPEQATMIIMRGLEVGLTPFQALDKIALVNGRPMIWGDGALGLVLASGLCEDISERIEGEGDGRVAICTTRRKGRATPIIGKFSVADAKLAGLWGKPGPWQQYQDRMLQMRARGFALHDGYADVLGGMYLREELEPAVPNKPASLSLASKLDALAHDPETGEIYENGAGGAPQAAPGNRLPENAAEYGAGDNISQDESPASVAEGDGEFKAGEEREWLEATAREMALSGRRTFDRWHKSLTPDEHQLLEPHMFNLRSAADKARGK